MYTDASNKNSQHTHVYIFVLLIIITIAFGPKLLQIGAGIFAITILIYIIFRSDFCENYLISNTPKNRERELEDAALDEIVNDDVEEFETARNAATYDEEFMRGDDLGEDYDYGRASREKYTNCRDPVPQSVDNCYKNAQGGFDEQAMRMSVLRQRNREAVEGSVTKNADAYRQFFGDELNKAENERWWGNNEF